MSANNWESVIAHRLVVRLDASAEQVDRTTAQKLWAAREKALSRHRPAAVGSIAMAGIGNFVSDLILPHARSLVAIIILAVGMSGYSHWSNLERATELEEVDAALLTDDLPIDAYIDRGFDAWLSTETPS